MPILNVDTFYSFLTGITSLTNKVTEISDTVPNGKALPYIQIGYIQEVNDEQIDNSGSEVIITLHIWATSKKEVLEIRDILKNNIQDWLLYDGITVLRDNDTKYFHGVTSFRYYI